MQNNSREFEEPVFSDLRIPDSRFWFSDSIFWIPDSGFQSLDSRVWIPVSGSPPIHFIWVFPREVIVTNILSLLRWLGHPNKMFRFPSASPSWRRVGRAGKKKKKWTHEGSWAPVKAGLLSTKAWLRGPFVCNQMLMRQDRMLVN